MSGRYLPLGAVLRADEPFTVLYFNRPGLYAISCYNSRISRYEHIVTTPDTMVLSCHGQFGRYVDLTVTVETDSGFKTTALCAWPEVSIGDNLPEGSLTEGNSADESE